MATVPSQRRGTVTFKYDPFGRRIYKSSSVGTSIYAYDRNSLVEETSSSGGVVARYVQHNLGIDEPLAMLRVGTASYYEQDGLGSVTSLTAGAGALAQTYTFDSFGKQTASSGSLVSPFQYTGREFDSESGLYFYRARYYDSSNGRFLTEDPAGFIGGINKYQYVSNNPVLFRDPSGLCPSGNIKPWDMRKTLVDLLRAKNDCSDWFNKGTGSAADIMSQVPINLYTPPNPSYNMPDANPGINPPAIYVNSLGRFYTDRWNWGLVGGSYPAGSIGARATILLHELAHIVLPPGFASDDASTSGASDKNTQTLLDHCMKAINALY